MSKKHNRKPDDEAPKDEPIFRPHHVEGRIKVKRVWDPRYRKPTSFTDPNRKRRPSRLKGMTTKEVFLLSVNKTSKCWLWSWGTREYGFFAGDWAHRWAWRLFKGPIPRGRHVLHHCDTPRCVNPKHLFLGNMRVNDIDKCYKGRQSGKRLLTPEKVRQIRKMAFAGLSYRRIAAFIGTDGGRVSRVVNRQSWAFVK